MKSKGYGHSVEKYLVKTSQGYFLGFSNGGPVFVEPNKAKVFEIATHAKNAAGLVDGVVVTLSAVLAEQTKKEHGWTVTPGEAQKKAPSLSNSIADAIDADILSSLKAVAAAKAEEAHDLAAYKAMANAKDPVNVVDPAAKLIVRWVIVIEHLTKKYKNFVFYGQPELTGKLTSPMLQIFNSIGEAQKAIANAGLEGNASPQKLVFIKGVAAFLRTPESDYPVHPGHAVVYNPNPGSELIFDHGGMTSPASEIQFTQASDANKFVVKKANENLYYLNKSPDGVLNWSYGFTDTLHPAIFDYSTATKVAGTIGGVVLSVAQVKVKEKFKAAGASDLNTMVGIDPNAEVIPATSSTAASTGTTDFAFSIKVKFDSLDDPPEPDIYLASKKYHSWPAGGKGTHGNYVVYKDGMFLASGPKKKVPLWTSDPQNAYLYDYWQTAEKVLNKTGGLIARMVVNANGLRIGLRTNVHHGHKPWHEYRWWVLRNKTTKKYKRLPVGDVNLYDTHSLGSGSKFISYKAAKAQAHGYEVVEVVLKDHVWSLKNPVDDSVVVAPAAPAGPAKVTNAHPGWVTGKTSPTGVTWIVAKDGKYLLSANDSTWASSPYACGFTKDKNLAESLSVKHGGIFMPMQDALTSYKAFAEATEEPWFATMANGVHFLTGALNGGPQWNQDVNKAVFFHSEEAIKEFTKEKIPGFPPSYYLFSQLITVSGSTPAKPETKPTAQPKKPSKEPFPVMQLVVAKGTSYIQKLGHTATETLYTPLPYAAQVFTSPTAAQNAAAVAWHGSVHTKEEAIKAYHFKCAQLPQPIAIANGDQCIAGVSEGAPIWSETPNAALLFHSVAAATDFVAAAIKLILPSPTKAVFWQDFLKEKAKAKDYGLTKPAKAFTEVTAMQLTKEGEKQKKVLQLLQKAHHMIKTKKTIADVDLVEKALDGVMDLLEEKIFG